MEEKAVAVARGWNLPISVKYARELGVAITGKPVAKALKFLEDVIAKKRPVELRRYNKEVPHHYGRPARWPVKAASHILKILKNAVANAVYKGLDREKLVVSKVVIGKGSPKRAWWSRVLRRNRRRGKRANVLIELMEVEEK